MKKDKKIKRPESKLSKSQRTNDYQKLVEQNEKLEKLLSIISRGKYLWESSFDAISTPVLIVSPDCIIERANLSASSVVKKEVTSLIGKHCYEVFAGSGYVCEGCPVKISLEHGSYTTSVKIKDKRYRVSAYPIRSLRPPLVVLTYLDVSEEHRLHREIIQQEKMAAIGMLSGGVAHEINNPLGGILAFTQLLLQTAKDEQLKEDLKEIESAALRCKKIISDLLDFSRSSKEGEQSLIDINDLMEKIFPFVQRELRSYNVTLDFRPSKNIPLVKVYSDRLQQVFLNVITNSCHAMPKGGKITIRTYSSDNDLMIEISDTGIGMSDETKKRIFEPFFTTKEPGKGTGLGLAISYRIINDHGGSIEVKSEVDKGTTFYIHLPVSEV